MNKVLKAEGIDHLIEFDKVVSCHSENGWPLVRLKFSKDYLTLCDFLEERVIWGNGVPI